MNKLEESIKILKNLHPKIYKQYPDRFTNELIPDVKLEEAIKTVLQELNNLQEKNQTLTQYIGSQGMISDYMKYKNSKNK